MSKDQFQRIAVGFAGGQVLNARVSEQVHTDLTKALEGGDELFSLEAEDGTVLVRTSQVVYVRVEREDQRVGFGL